MALDIIALALDFIAAYGLIAILVLLVLDGALLLPVFPGEIVLIMAVASYVHDVPSLIFIILVTTAAGLAGSVLLYSVTRGGGRRLVERFPRFFMMPRKRRERLERSFKRPVGQSMVLFLRLIPLTRILVNIPAGLARMPFVRFMILSTIGLLAYHAAFLWFAYEANRPGSPVSDQKEHLQEAYASPAWAFIEANQIIAGLGLLVLGAVIAMRGAAKMHKDPEESTGSLIGWLTTAILLWGGIALAVATYMEPNAVYAIVDLGGLDIHAIAAVVGYSAVEVLWAASGVAVLFGLVLSRVRRSATMRRKEFKAHGKARAAAVERTADQDVAAAARADLAPSEEMEFRRLWEERAARHDIDVGPSSRDPAASEEDGPYEDHAEPDDADATDEEAWPDEEAGPDDADPEDEEETS